MIVVDLLLATICFGTPQVCHPALIGKNTPRGSFTTTLRLTEQLGYSGDIIQFYETSTHVYAIHRTWTVNAAQKREQRLAGPIAGRTITSGCINVAPVVYEKLKNCCVNQIILIK